MQTQTARLEIWSEPEWCYMVLRLGSVRVGWYLGALRLSVWRVWA